MRSIVLAVVVCLFPALVSAQDFPKTEVSGRYSFTRVDLTQGVHVNCHGLAGDVAVNATPWFGVVGDFNFCKAPNVGQDLITLLGGAGLVTADVSTFTLMGGPRFSFRSQTSRITPYFQFLVGVAHATLTVSTTSIASQLIGAGLSVNTAENGFAFAPGGGINVKLTNHVGLRAVQFDYLATRISQETENNLRIQSGVNFTF